MISRKDIKTVALRKYGVTFCYTTFFLQAQEGNCCWMMTRPRDQVSAEERMIYIEEHISEPHPSMRKLQEVRDTSLVVRCPLQSSNCIF
ncbi:hypothetical protein EB796_002822 [Bugula neritina]|uniref:Uncharacterized protein n=1 Tax=Bugula neritina TaxID=10212 RepID=A0A7J7KL76_BUGNE|nr:hypothetical protein EB796_002822 [Bugula neritina]